MTIDAGPDFAILTLVSSNGLQFTGYAAFWYYFTSAADWCLRLF
jgi:hypothetical protein